MRGAYLRLIVAMLCFLFAGPAWAASVSPPPQAALPSLNGNMAILVDPSWSLTLADVFSPERQMEFRPIPGPDVNLGYTRNAAWLRLELEGTQAAMGLLSLTPNFLDFIDIYTARQGPALLASDFSHHAMGDHRPLPADGLSGLANVVPLEFAKGETTLVYIRLANTNSATHLNVRLYPQGSHTVQTTRASLAYGAWFGGMGVLFIVQLVFYCFDRKLHYPLLALSTLGIMLVYTSNLGVSRLLLFPDNGPANDLFMGAVAWFGLFASALAYSSILELPSRAPKLHRVYQATAGVGLIGVGFALFKSNIVFGPFGNSFSIVMGVLNITLGLRYANEDGTASRLRAAAFCIVWIGAFLSLGQRLGYAWLPNIFWHAYAVSGLLQAILLTGALAVRLRTAEAMNTVMREQALITAQDAERSANMLVEERTRELVQARKIAEDALDAELRSQEQQVRFMEVISHQYRTPLASIRSTVDSIAISLPSGDDANHGRIDRIRRAIVRLVEMLEVNRARSRLQGPSFQPQLALIAPGDVVSAAAMRGRDLFQRAEIDVDLGSGATELRIMADPGMLELAIINLLENAVKFSAARGAPAIVLSLTSSHDKAVISVTDRGIGIPPADLERVTTNGVRGSNAGNIEGSGMGLSLVSRVAAAHGGTVEITSDIDAGTTVRIVLPLADVRPAGASMVAMSLQ
ncbi:ATP-binding protein [Mesorhizobium sp. ANAO-SY3R2]|uniref:sensor histidine kinase n=1 Tax=Mesorhizobium sp. ANAO-SY3R2 TaxID=3166644 RepID=UPI00367254E6